MLQKYDNHAQKKIARRIMENLRSAHERKMKTISSFFRSNESASNEIYSLTVMRYFERLQFPFNFFVWIHRF